MSEGSKVKIGSKVRIMLPNGDIHILSSRTGKTLRRILTYKKGAWYNNENKKANFNGKDETLLLKKLKALQGTKSLKVPKKVKKTPPKSLKVPKKVVKKPKNLEPKETLEDITKIKVGDNFLCTYKKYTFFVKKAPATMGSGYILVEELKDGSQEGIPGLFDKVKAALLYFKKIKEISDEEAHRIKTNKGGRVLNKINWHVNDRIVFAYLGAFYIGSVVQVLKDWMTEQIKTVVAKRDGEEERIELDVTELNILGKGIDEQNTEPIPPQDIDKWIIEEKEKIKKFSYVLDERADLPESINLEKHWQVFIKKIFTQIKEPVFKKMVREHMLEYPLKIIEPVDNPGLEGQYWNNLNTVDLNWKHILNCNKRAAITLVHEVIHYKLFPVKNKLRTLINNHIFKILGINKLDPKIKTWAKVFLAPKKKMKGFSHARVKKLVGLTFKEPDMYYALTYFNEVPATILSYVAVGDKLEKPMDKLAELIYTEFEHQLKK